MKEKLVTILFSLFMLWTSFGLLFHLFVSDNKADFIFYIAGIMLVGGLFICGYLLIIYPLWIVVLIISIVIGINFIIEGLSLFNFRISLLDSSAVHANSFFIRETLIKLTPFGLALIWLLNIAICHLLWKQITRGVRGWISQGSVYVIGATLASMSIERLLAPSLLNIKRYSWLQGESYIYGSTSTRLYMNWLFVVGLLHLFIWLVLELSGNWNRVIMAEYRYQMVAVYSLIVFCTMVVGLYTLDWLTVFMFILFNGLTYVLYIHSKKEKDINLSQCWPSFFQKKKF